MLQRYLIEKLKLRSVLDAQDQRALEELPVYVKDIAPGTCIVSEGGSTHQSCLVVEGLLVRSKTIETGKRQIVSIHIPGDVPDLQSLYLRVMDYELRSCGEAKVGLIPHDALRRVIRSRPNVAEALWRDTLVDASIFREWIVNTGRRPALNRVAHLLAELAERLDRLGLIEQDTVTLAMTQSDLADAVGLTNVHANRVLKTLRDAQIVDFRRGSVRILDREKLKKLGGFDQLYLHPE